MTNLGFKGIDVRQTGGEIVFRASLKNLSGAKLTTGTTYLYLFEVQSDGSLKSYDFGDNTFKTSALTTNVAAMTHRTGNNGTYSTGIWTYSLANLEGFTTGAVYIAQVYNSGASPNEQEREFQYGSEQGDLVVSNPTQLGVGIGVLRTIFSGFYDWGMGTDNFCTSAGAPDGFIGFNNFIDGGGDPAYFLAAALGDKSIPIPQNATGGYAKTQDQNGNALGTAASQTTIANAINAIQNLAARSGPKVPQPFVIPATGSTTYEFDLYLWALNGQPDVPDAAPTVHAKDQSGTTLDANLGSTTMTLVAGSTGHYKGIYTLAAGAVYSQVTFAFAWAVSSIAMQDGEIVAVLSEDQSTLLAAINAKTMLIGTNAGDSPNQQDSQGIITANLDAKISSRASQASVDEIPSPKETVTFETGDEVTVE